MKHTAPTLTQHRNARLIAWGRLMLAWVGAALFSNALYRISDRHILARAWYLNLDRVAVSIANIILLHAFAQMNARPGKRFTVFDYSAHGFARRTRVRNITRAGRGSWLRKRLHHRDPLTRFNLIVQALNDIDALAERAARRLRRGLTRLFAIRAVRPPHERANTLATPPVLAADSS